jgi:hypothetical protein
VSVPLCDRNAWKRAVDSVRRGGMNGCKVDRATRTCLRIERRSQ